MSDSYVTPWTIACLAPLSMRFPRQEYWSGLPFPSPVNVLNPGIEPASHALAGQFFTTERAKKSRFTINKKKKRCLLRRLAIAETKIYEGSVIHAF